MVLCLRATGCGGTRRGVDGAGSGTRRAISTPTPVPPGIIHVTDVDGL